ncbi:peptidyl-prolyl cis-trans isomerase SurA [Ereboglobus sp. PH5-5]|uniref:peptidylprolyl isomerase n=1 Tax=Ereboglobus sp. PH5-5 TaxID=2940529 RepID=UPI002406ACC6|nr:peptidyl-prolyl cis-trans isomerase [Ereboglobus sp. PH5-5]MDF9833226.1 peptidyl-prolyl cis-trans isomerase SurA [Ereboglobus sp. PH5-5]
MIFTRSHATRLPAAALAAILCTTAAPQNLGAQSPSLLDPGAGSMSLVPDMPAPAPQQAEPAAPQEMDLRLQNAIVAVVEEKAITMDDIRREITPLLPQIIRESTSEQDYLNKIQALQDDIVQNHIDRALIVKEFYKEKDGEPVKSIPASYIDNQLEEIIITQYDNDRSKFLAYLRAKGQTIREFRKEIEEDMINGYMRQQQRKSQSVVSPVKVETFYRENKDRFYQDDQVHLRLIQFTRNNQTDGELISKANDVVNRMKNGEKFEDIAKEVSQDTRRSKGGDWGWQKRSDLKAELSEPLFKLQKGEVTEPILMPEGAFLMYVEDRKYAGIQPIDEVRDQIERIVLQQMARASQEQWLERLRRNGYIKYF